MDGIHDLGGMHGFGAVVVERDEPVFHQRWEGRVFAIASLVSVGGVDKFRHGIERLAPVTYLTAGYYGRWLLAVANLLVEAGTLEEGAVERRAAGLSASRDRAPAASPVAPEEHATDPGPRVAAADREPAAASPQQGRRGVTRLIPEAPRFRVGDAIRARNLHPPGHTRLPRYARGRCGRIATVYQACVFPDTHAHGAGENPQYVYSVAFRGEELWGRDAEPGTTVHLDLFESYLEAHDG